MSRYLDMSLDEIIRKNGRPAGRSNSTFKGRNASWGSASSSGPGPERRLHREPTRNQPYPTQPVMQVVEPMIMVGDGGSSGEAGIKLYLSNLDFDVSNEDIEVLFSELGELIRHSIHYDRSGRSKGTAEVVFKRQTDALAAIKRYNNVQLDGKPMKIEIVGLNMLTPASIPVTAVPVSILPEPNVAFRSNQERVGAWGRGRGGGNSGRARGHWQGRRQVERLTAQDLDSDLEKYHFDAMKMN